MMTAAILAIIGGVVWILHILKELSQNNREINLKEAEHEAEKIVKSKTAGELVDDFNKRYGGGPKRPDGSD